MRAPVARVGLASPRIPLREAAAHGTAVLLRATGSACPPGPLRGDPILPLVVESGGGLESIGPGWYAFDMTLASAQGAAPCLLVDCGEGYVSVGSATPRRRGAGHALRTVIAFPRAPRALALLAGDEGTAAPVEAVLLHRVSRPYALARMLREIGILSSTPALAGTLLRFGRDWLTRGRAAATQGLLQRYHLARNDPQKAYRRWVELFSRQSFAADHAPGRGADPPTAPPRFTVLMLAADCAPRLLDRAIASLLAQHLPEWELRIAVTGNSTAAVRAVVERHARLDPRVVPVRNAGCAGMADAYNAALWGARGATTLVLGAEDALAGDALAEIEAARSPGGANLVYVDDDRIDAAGTRHAPQFKPDWAPDLWLSRTVLDGLVAIDTDVVRRLGGFARGYDACCVYELALRSLDSVPRRRITHVAQVLHHRGGDRPVAAQRTLESARAAVEAHAARQGIEGSVEVRAPHGCLIRRQPARWPAVDVVIPTRDQPRLLKRCIDSLVKTTSYPDLRITVVDNGSCLPETLRYLAALKATGRATVIHAPGPFNFSALVNRAVHATNGEITCLLNDDIEAIVPGWLEEMVAHALRDEIGAVGAKLYFPDGRIQHAGVVTGLHGIAAHVHHGAQHGDAGYFGRASLVQNYTAVTGACLVVQRSRFMEVGGFDESLGVCYNDVDFCLKLRERGYANVWTPAAELLHFESASRGRDDTPAKRERHEREAALMIERWGDALLHDPAYNRNLSLTGPGFELAFPPRPPSRACRQPMASAAHVQGLRAS